MAAHQLKVLRGFSSGGKFSGLRNALNKAWKPSFMIAAGASIGACAFRFALEHALMDYKGVIQFESSFVTMCIFVQAIVLSGVLADYKECEKIPAQLAMSLETILTTMRICMELDPKARDEAPLLFGYLKDMVDAHLQLFIRAADPTSLPLFLEDLTRLTCSLVGGLRRSGLAREGADVMAELGKVNRPTAARVTVIAQTSFMPSAYLLYDSMVVAVLAMLQLAVFSTRATQYALICLLTFLFTYMSRLIRDADDPVEYGAFTGVEELVAALGGRVVGGDAKLHPTPVRFISDDEVGLQPLVVVRDRVLAQMERVWPAEDEEGDGQEEGGGGNKAGANAASPRERPVTVLVPDGVMLFTGVGAAHGGPGPGSVEFSTVMSVGQDGRRTGHTPTNLPGALPSPTSFGSPASSHGPTPGRRKSTVLRTHLSHGNQIAMEVHGPGDRAGQWGLNDVQATATYMPTM